ncbi:hypothetical protein PR003_g1818 [Phytophthora rubi]|uniref:Uncharacterized protein n=1 Tax=Phytophthora rubi TaxID=129364 RepID=A0A6A4G2L9_9STRA|nr:hypothetical protein PR002_g1717 [Phytophthora rubi]KAE9047447.1 hypothetical protein PR001_g4196 [Phytophthora rubi]KAE9357399.1 hypothetical protein PR003_g1818 [Phytophthora rubi]
MGLAFPLNLSLICLFCAAALIPHSVLSTGLSIFLWSTGILAQSISSLRNSPSSVGQCSA